MKYSVFAILLCVFCCFLSAGCVSVMQTSAMLLEDREYEIFPVPEKAAEARWLDGVLYLKCPVRKYVRKHTLVRMAITPSCFGGFQYKPAGPSEDRFVWIKATSELPLFPDPWTFEYDPDQDALKKRLASANHAEVPADLCFCIFFYGFDREPDRMNTILPLVEARSENSIPRIILAYADGFFVDFPASLFMTLTGSFWYLPLTEYAEK